MADIANAERLIFPGVGAYEQAMGVLAAKGYIEPLKDYIQVPRAVPLLACNMHATAAAFHEGPLFALHSAKAAAPIS